MANLLPDEIDKVDQVLTPWVDRPDQVVEVDAGKKCIHVDSVMHVYLIFI